MSVFIGICVCGKKVGIPRLGSVTGNDGHTIVDNDLKSKCPFCGRDIFSKDGIEIAEPQQQDEPIDLLAVE